MRFVHTLSLVSLLAILAIGRGSAQPHLFFLHNRFIEEHGTEADHPGYGNGHYYEILDAFRSYGFTVHSELRRLGTDARPYARRIVAQVDSLLASGVPPGDITIVGTSKGGLHRPVRVNLPSQTGREFRVRRLLPRCRPAAVG